MFESKYNKLLTAILIIVVFAILGLLGFLVYNYVQETNSTKNYLSVGHTRGLRQLPILRATGLGACRRQ